MLLLAILACSTPVMAQEVKMKKADRYFELFKFDQAIEQYKRVLDKAPSNYKALKRLGDSYRLKGVPTEAEFWYSEAAKHAEADSEAVFFYAQALRDNGKYDLAKEQYLKYAQMAPSDTRAKQLAASMDKIAELKVDSSRYSVYLVPGINSNLSDFSPAFYQDSSLVFASARGKGKKDLWSGAPFLDLYVATKSDTGFASPTPLPGKLNAQFHEGPVTFTPSYTEMYFTRNNYKKRKTKTSDDDIMKMIVMHSTLNDGEWSDLENLDFNSTEYSVQHPTLSADGKTLYFSSDMPGGYGRFDLWMTTQSGEGKWGAPVNLGPGINTSGDEGFPYIAHDGTMYFASDAYIGLGGLDIYSATNNGGWGNVKNMGYPINTSYDDFGLIMNKRNDGGYFSSNRPGGPGGDDIYSFDKGILLAGLVYDRLTGDSLPGSTVHLVLQGDTLQTVITDDYGKFNFRVAENKTYDLPAGKTGYLPNKLTVSTEGLGPNSPPVRIPLDRGALMLVGTTYEVRVDEGTKMENRIGTMPKVIVKLYNVTDNTVDSVLSDANGGFVFSLSPEKEYRLTGDKENYFLKSEKTFDTRGKVSGTVEADLELYLLEGTIRLVNIYYDFDKYNIRPDAAKELDRVYDILVRYPDMVIQMRSHTDCRAPKTYNMWLSANRAQSAANYLINKGMKGKKDMLKNITAAGFGESVPVIPNLCKTEQGVPDSKISKQEADQHQMNRRTEFYVIKQPKAIHVEGSVTKR
ncbi:MAG: OmpA family protein [Chitinophagales bacterium]|nr:OmpA family protein [Chitinophagales bacterium]